MFWGLFPLIFLVLIYKSIFLLIAVIPFASRNYLNRLYKRKVDGYTGDCLGATQQVSEVIFLCSLL